MKIYCSCCDKVQPVRVDDCLDAKTNEPFQDIACNECGLVIASGTGIITQLKFEAAVGTSYKTGWEHGKSKEREACAKLCDEIAIDKWNLYKGRPPYKGDEQGRASYFTQGCSAGADDCAEAIRARSNA